MQSQHSKRTIEKRSPGLCYDSDPGIEVRHLDLPLIKPYALSYKTFESFEPYLVKITTSDGKTAFGEQHISPGSSSETREGGWSFLTSSAEAIVGSGINEVFDQLSSERTQSPVAASAILNARPAQRTGAMDPRK